MKKLLLALGTVAAVAAPVASVIACGNSNNSTNYGTKFSEAETKAYATTAGDATITALSTPTAKGQLFGNADIKAFETSVDPEVYENGDNIILVLDEKNKTSNDEPNDGGDVTAPTVPVLNLVTIETVKATGQIIDVHVEMTIQGFKQKMEYKANDDGKLSSNFNGTIKVLPIDAAALKVPAVTTTFAKIAKDRTDASKATTHKDPVVDTTNNGGPDKTNPGSDSKVPVHHDKVGLGDGKTYSPAQIAARDAATGGPATKADAAKAVPKVPNTPEQASSGGAVAAVGAGDGKHYTQAQIDKRDGGDKVAPTGAVVGSAADNAKLIPEVPAKGAGDGKAHTQAQIDARDATAAPDGAVVGAAPVNAKAVPASLDKTKAPLAADLKAFEELVTSDDEAKALKAKYADEAAWKAAVDGAKDSIEDLEALIKDEDTLTAPTWGKNVAKVPAKGAGDGEHYTQAQIDKRDGGDKVAPTGAVVGSAADNAKLIPEVPAKGARDGKAHTQAQIDARDATAAPAKAVEGLNSAAVAAGQPTPAVGDGSGNTYTQAQIDHVLGGDKVAPAGAVAGENKAAYDE